MPFDPSAWPERIERAIWTPQLATLPAWKRHAVHAARMVVVLGRDIGQGEIRLWAMSLVYTTLLSIVPLLALAFSVLKAFGVHNQVRPLLDNILAPLGPHGEELSRRVVGFIEHMNVGVLGALGLAMLVYTVVSLIQKVEESFNGIWHVPELRRAGERFSRYLSVLLVGPLLVFAAIGVTAAALSSSVAQSLLAVEPLGTLAVAAGRFVPYILMIGAFTFLYMFVPNTRVRFLPALGAGVLGGAMWQTAGWAFAAFVVSSTRYAAIYSSFAILVLLLIWLYVSWLVLLVGAAVSFYFQHPEYLYRRGGEPPLSNRMRERLALAVMQLVAANFARGADPWTVHGLAQHLGVPTHSVRVMLEALARGGFVARTGGDAPSYLPARDLRAVTAGDVLAAVRRAGEDDFLNPEALPLPAALEEILEARERVASHGVTLAELAGARGDGAPAS
jgi:membrane protein